MATPPDVLRRVAMHPSHTGARRHASQVSKLSGFGNGLMDIVGFCVAVTCFPGARPLQTSHCDCGGRRAIPTPKALRLVWVADRLLPILPCLKCLVGSLVLQTCEASIQKIPNELPTAENCTMGHVVRNILNIFQAPWTFIFLHDSLWYSRASYSWNPRMKR